MPSFANIEILGHVGREPEQRYTQQGTMLASFSVAVNPPGIRQPDGSYVDAPTDWFRVTCFGKTAERVVRDITKGQVVHVRGRFKTDCWTAQDGTARTNLDIAADSVTNVTPRGRTVGDDVQEAAAQRFIPGQKNNEGPLNADIDSLPF